MHSDLGDPCLGDAAVEAATEVARLDRGAVPGGEDQAGIDPGVPGLLAVGVLLLPAELERGDAQVRKGKRGFKPFGLGGTAQELAADTLQLLTDVQFGVVEADQLPGEAEELALAQAQDQKQDVGRVEPPSVADRGAPPVSSMGAARKVHPRLVRRG